MVVSNWLSLKLSDIFAYYDEGAGDVSIDRNELSLEQKRIAQLKAQREWRGAIASLQQLLLATVDPAAQDRLSLQGLLLSAPTPITSLPSLVANLQTGIFRIETSPIMALMPCKGLESKYQLSCSPVIELPLLIHDPLTEEQFCLVFTSRFALVMVLGEDRQGLAKFHFSFDPELIEKVWLLLRSRLLLTGHHQLSYLDRLVEQFAPPIPDYRLVSQFTRHLLNHLTPLATHNNQKTTVKSPQTQVNQPQTAKISLKKTPLPPYPEVELLQALTHEIRTPLTTIRTVTRLLLKRAKLSPDVAKHLELIEQECTEQINRMELIFRAAELETTNIKEEQVRLIPISLEQIFEQSIPRWKKQAQRRNVVLDIILPQKLPQIVSDPAMLEQILTGLMEKFTYSLPTGGKIKVLVSTAGNQLKLQFLSKSNYSSNPLKSLGQLLMFQPETGSLSLNLNVTKNIFQALGGKLIVRQKPQQGEVLTIFLPLGNSSKNLVSEQVNICAGIKK
jgi:signal transduction histidine kinase